MTTILVSGSSGLVGSALVPFLNRSGEYVVRRLVRRSGRAVAEPHIHEFVCWDPDAGAIDTAALEGVEAVVHLAGENIAAGRWTAARKERILDSRAGATTTLCESLANLPQPPKVLVCASAVGYYGDRGDEILTEESPAGFGFLAAVCQEWERATHPAADRGIRVVNLRFGMILTASGGALAKMLVPFRLGLGGVVGNGRQFISWISLDDAVSVIHHALTTDTLSGPINGVTPNPVTNREFTRTLGRVLQRPTLFPLPSLVARLALGEMADELLLASCRVQPERLLATGYGFQQPLLEGALWYLLRRCV